MATQAMRLPAEFLTAPDRPVMDVDLYIEELENYLLAAGTEKFSEARRVAILLNIVGFTTRKIFKAASPTPCKNTTEVFDLLRKLFPSSQSYTLAREKFNRRTQRETESVMEFFTDISNLSLQCNYGTLREDLIRDKLVMCVHPDIKQKLILEQPKTLQTALETAQRIETISNELRVSSPPEVNAVSSRPSPSPNQQPTSVSINSKRPYKKSYNRARVSNNSSKFCYRCGNSSHLANDSSCPAKDKTCNKCGVKGHFSKVCFSSTRGTSSVQDRQDGVGMIFSNFADKLDNFYSPMKFVQVDCVTTTENDSSTESRNIRFGIDTGSAVNLMSKIMFSNIFPNCTLRECNRQLHDFSGNPIHITGCVSLEMQYDGVLSVEDVYVVDTNNPPLLGICAFESLKLHRLWSNSSLNVIGRVDKYIHKITLQPDAVPVKQKLRRVPLSLRDKVSQELKSLVESDIIEPIHESDWASNIVVVQKPNGKLRLCVDLRELNKNIVSNMYPLPHIDEVFLKLKDCCVYSVIDLKHAFLQVPLHPDSRPMTAFLSHEGLFQFKKIPYGLASAPCAFQRLMTEILGNQKCIQVYMDDILIGGSSQSEHDERLNYVLTKLKKAGFSINMEKSLMSKPEIKFMGHIISKQGISPDPEKVKAIVSAPAPTTAQEVKSFLGTTAFYAKFLPSYSSVVEPLLQLTRKNATWSWNEEQQASYDTLLQLIADTTKLSIFQHDRKTEVHVDASGSGIGAVLLQRDSEENVHIIAFASRTLTPAERRYAVIEREALAISFAIEKWKIFLWGFQFQIATDHRPLVSIFNSRDTLQVNARISRFVTRLLPYNYTVYYKAGPDNVIADFLSRVTPNDSEADNDQVDPEGLIVNSILSDTTISKTDLQNISETDPEMRVIQKWLCGEKLSTEEEKIVSFYQSVKHELTIADKILFRGTDRVVPPKHLRKIIIQLAHEAHQGQNRTYQQLQTHYWWPSMFSQVKSYIVSCTECNSSPKTAKFVTPDPVKLDVPTEPWTKLGIDIIGPMYELPHDSRFAITLMDYTSKFPYVHFTPDIDSQTVVNFLISVFALEGIPVTLCSDNGPQFVSREFTEFLRKNDIEHLRTPVYHARANGLIERWNRTLKSQIEIGKQNRTTFRKYVSNFLAAYRSTPHADTGVTPTSLLHGRQMRWAHNSPVQPLTNDTSHDFTTDEDHQHTSTIDHTRKYEHPSYSQGEEVRVRMPDKNSSRVVQKRVGKHTYEMTDGHRWHVSNMSKKRSTCTQNRIPLRDFRQARPPPRYPPRNREPPSRYILQDTTKC